MGFFLLLTMFVVWLQLRFVRGWFRSLFEYFGGVWILWLQFFKCVAILVFFGAYLIPALTTFDNPILTSAAKGGYAGALMAATFYVVMIHIL